MGEIEDFNLYRQQMNERILKEDNLVLKRFFSLDSRTYEDGALSMKTKEMLGLVSSMVLRCDDCIKYHLEKCFLQGVTTAELFELMAVANVVGGSIVIPHTRRAVAFWDLLQDSENANK